MSLSETLCVRCGYNLHGLPEEHSCPECGLDKIVSTHSESFEWFKGKYRLCIRWGIGLLLISQVAWIVLIIMNDYFSILFPIPVALAASGAMLLTGHPYRRRTIWERAVRWTAVLTLVTATGVAYSDLFDMSFPFLQWVFGSAWCLCILATYQQLRILAERAWAFNAADLASFTSYGLPVLMVLFPAGFLGSLIIFGEFALIHPLFWVIVLPLGGALLAMYLVALVVLLDLFGQLSVSRLSRFSVSI